MNYIKKMCVLFALLCSFFSLNSAFALDQADRSAIETIVKDYMDAWNLHGGNGYADNFADDADFVNIHGMYFKGRSEIEIRHVKIIETHFKDSVFKLNNLQLREVQPGVVIALVYWTLDGFRNPGESNKTPGETREGIYTQVFINKDNKWEITASQNTVKPKQS